MDKIQWPIPGFQYIVVAATIHQEWVPCGMFLNILAAENFARLCINGTHILMAQPSSISSGPFDLGTEMT